LAPLGGAPGGLAPLGGAPSGLAPLKSGGARHYSPSRLFVLRPKRIKGSQSSYSLVVMFILEIIILDRPEN
jgi:hypothetical protein